MRLKNLVIGEFFFLWKYGIIVLYAIFTVFYLCLLGAIPVSVRETAATILIFTDPAAMGLFFMGAVVLFEKSQRVESSLGVSPVKISEYVVAKIVPMMLIGCAVATVLCAFSYTYTSVCLIGVALSSILFSLCGLAVGSNIRSLNGFMIATLPFEIILCVPAVLYQFGVIESSVWIVHPGVAAIYLIGGQMEVWYMAALSILIWILPIYILCKKAVNKSFVSMGGAKL